MKSAIRQAAGGAAAKIAVDIGSTVVKLAKVDHGDRILTQEFRPRDFEAGISRQVEVLLADCGVPLDDEEIMVCSSANGGLRVGMISLTKGFSGAALRSQVLLAGANPMFLRELDEDPGVTGYVDMLIVAGGIDCDDAAPLQARLQRLRLDGYRYGSLVYAGNRHLAPAFLQRFPQASVLANPISDDLSGRTLSVFEGVRRAYLDDLVYKQGVSELRSNLARGIRPTPEVVSRGFQRAVMNRSSIVTGGSAILLDVGGATTDLHYTVEILRDDSPSRPSPGMSVARYVFTDLGIVASRDTLVLQLRSHPRLYELIEMLAPDDVRDTYRQFREGEYEPSSELLSYGCLLLALDRFAQGNGPGLPSAQLEKVSQYILSGGAAQLLTERTASKVIKLLLSDEAGAPAVMIDRKYQIWVDGITWTDRDEG